MDNGRRIRTARWNMYRYRANKDAVENYFSNVLYGTNDVGVHGIQTSNISDPTARGGIALATLPDDLKEKWEWVKAVDEAWEECKQYDSQNEIDFGLAYVMEKQFCLTGEKRPKSKNAVAKLKICRDCHIAERTYYNWLRQITDAVVYYATKRGIL